MQTLFYRLAGTIEGIVTGNKFILKQREMTQEEMTKVLDDIFIKVMVEFNKVESDMLKKEDAA